MKRYLATISTLFLTAIGWSVSVAPTLSQTTSLSCQPPNPEEYLLLVLNPALNQRSQIEKVLPATAETSVCDYQNQSVIRVSGFSSLEIANAWAQYLAETSGAEAIVARPSGSTTPTQSVTTQTQSSVVPRQAVNVPSGYQPQPLGTGYAVLVDYRNRPEVALQAQRLLGKAVGLAAYGQRPYLLAGYTQNPDDAREVLQTLSDRGFWVMLVDSRRVVVLKPTVTVSTPER